MPLRQLFNLRKNSASRQWNSGKLKNREKAGRNTQQNAPENQHENPAHYRKFYLSSDFLSKAAWEAASLENRLRYWQAADKGINGGLCLHLDTLRQRSRDAVRNNPYAASAVNVWVSNLIGKGIKAQLRAEDRAFRETLQTLWSRWMLKADAQKRSHFYGLQAQICQHVIESGECLVRFLVDKRDSSTDLNDSSALPIVPLRLQLLEAEHLDGSQDRELPNGHRIQGGIELNHDNQRVAYYLYQSHPHQNGLNDTGDLTTLRVPASQILHIYRMDHPGQLRGVPWLSPVLLKLHDLDQYDDAELVRKKVAAIFAGFVTRPDPESQFFGEAEVNRRGVELAGLEPGTLQFLHPGEEIKFSEPCDVGGNYMEFMRQQLRAIAAGIGISYEQLTGDLAQVSYSSIRAGSLEFRRRCTRLQHDLMTFQFCQPVWERWLEVALQHQLVKLPENRRDFDLVDWVPPVFDWIDPLRDRKAQAMAVRNGFKSRCQVVSELGREVEDVDEEIRRDRERAQSYGLRFDSHD
jgi:lambda family phage portal protein